MEIVKKNIINLEKYGHSPGKKKKIDIEKYIYTIKARNSIGVNHDKELPEEYLKEVKDFLKNEHKSLLQESFGDEKKKAALRKVVSQYLIEKPNLPGFSLEELTKLLVDAVAGLDVLESIAENPNVTDIICNEFDEIWVTDLKEGKYRSNIQFKNRAAYETLCYKFAYASGQTWSYSKPECDAFFPNLRINLMGFDISQDGISLAVRKFTKGMRINRKSILETNHATETMLDLLRAIVRTRSRILISGSTGAGKTELLKYLIGDIHELDRILMIQDNPEVFLKFIYPDRDIKTWITREREGIENGIDIDRLNRSALRQFIKWLIIGESRGGGDAWGMVKAAKTGHPVITTLHSFGAIDSIERVVDMCSEKVNMSLESLYRSVANNFDFGIHLEQTLDGTRRITEIVEYTGYKDGEVQYNKLFSFDIESEIEYEDEKGRTRFKVEGYHKQKGYLSDFRIKEMKKARVFTKQLEVLQEDREKADLTKGGAAVAVS
ncbi:CpaF family protein [Bacillus cereus]|uniref:CpaF family protein n=1 Tax=Bacillus cereus TaxID=1396 RepID=UPI003D65542D